MRSLSIDKFDLSTPPLIEKTRLLEEYLKTLSEGQIATSMHLSKNLAAKTKQLIKSWSDDTKNQSPALDSFIGDIYSGLRASEFTEAERQYANSTLRILSGLYGVIKPLDGISLYRLEMGYRLPNLKYSNLYKFWGDSIANTLPKSGLVINTSAEEYTKAVLPYIDSSRVITPRFFTKDPITRKPKFVVVHSKIARGAYARWLINNQVNKPQYLNRFDDLNYRYSKALSINSSPAYVCDSFGGLGLSVRLK